MLKIFGITIPGRTAFLIVTESFLVYFALWFATVLWFGKDADLALTYDYNLQTFSVAWLVCMLCLYYHDLYESSVMLNPREIAVRLIQVLGTVSITLALVYFAWPAVQLGRGPFVVWVALVGVLLAAWRKMFLVANRTPALRERVAVLGRGWLARNLVEEVRQRPDLGFELVGWFDVAGDHSGNLPGENWSDVLEQLDSAVRQRKLHRLVIALDERRGLLPVEDLLRLKALGLRVDEGTEFYEAVTAKVPVVALRPSSLLFSEGFRASPAMVALKRAASIAASVLGLIVSAPLLLFITVAIRLDSRGPVLFRQQRVGQGGRMFTLYKFRTMRVDADHNQPASLNDPRVTRVGRWLRRTRLDELPQLYNILKGDMDFIGPRPFIPDLEAVCASQIPFYTQRWNVRPGITGWAQVHNGYCSTLEDNIEKLGYDLYYIKNMSVGLDLLILFQTTKILLLGRGAR